MVKLRALVKAIHYTVWLALLALFVVTTVLPATAQTNFRISFAKRGSSGQVLDVPLKTENRRQEFFIAQLQKTKSQVENEGLNLLEEGRNLFDAGRFSEAATLWERAAKEYESQGDRLQEALTLSYLSNAYQELGQWTQAEAAITNSLNLICNGKQPCTPTGSALIFAQALNTQGSLQLAMGQTEVALETWKQAEQTYAAAGDEAGKLGSQINQAQALRTLGFYRRAKNLLIQVNEKLQQQPDSILKATGLRSLGVALQVVGDLTQSQQVLEQSLAIAQRLNSATEISATLLSLGNTVRALQNPESAVEIYQKAADSATNAIAKLEAQLNQLSLLVETQQPAAIQALLPAIQSQLANLSPSRDAVYAQVNFAQSLLKLSGEPGNNDRGTMRQPRRVIGGEDMQASRGGGESGTAEEWERKRNLPPHSLLLTPHPSLLTPHSSLLPLATAVQQARMLQDPRAESYALGQLGYLYRQTQQWSEAQDLTEKALIIAQGIGASDIVARWQGQLGQILQQQGDISKAIAVYTEAVNTLRSLRTDLVAISPNVQFTFQESVEPVYRQLVGLLLKSNPTQDNLKQARELIEALQLAELDNFFREACLDVKPQQIDQIDPTAAVIYPIILPDRLEVILSIPGEPLRHYTKALPQSKVETTLDALLEALNPFFSSEERLRLSQEVYDWLIRPAEAQLSAGGIKTLVFVLDGSLRNLPMAALYDGKQYLVEKYNIGLTPGLQLLAPRSLSQKQLRILTAGLTEARQGFSALPGVKLEVDRIASEIPSKVFLNQAFTETNLQNQIEATSYPIVHLATHGQFSSNPEQTFILTWDEKVKVKEFEDLLRAREQNRPNPIELLVLSACQTAAGDKRAALGLAGVAVRSGARSTLATLWSVKDESTAKLMTEFYQYLSQGASKAQALRTAQLALLKQSKYEHPFYWAPFILVGNWL